MIDRAVTRVLLPAPALLVMLLVGILPPRPVLSNARHDTLGGNTFSWGGVQRFRRGVGSPAFWAAMARSAGFAAPAPAVQGPLGLWTALHMPR
jgi:ABC-type sugar transport system permease subunit